MTTGIGNEWDPGDPPEIHEERKREKRAFGPTEPLKEPMACTHPKACWKETVRDVEVEIEGYSAIRQDIVGHCTACEHERLAVAAALREAAEITVTDAAGVPFGMVQGHRNAILALIDQKALDAHDAEVRDRALNEKRLELCNQLGIEPAHSWANIVEKFNEGNGAGRSGGAGGIGSMEDKRCQHGMGKRSARRQSSQGEGMSRKERWPFEASIAGLFQQTMLLRSKLLPAHILHCEYMFHPSRKWRFDLALPDLNIACEYHGGLFMPRKGGHQTVKGTRNDWEKLNEAQILGWIVLQFGPDETRSGEAMNVIERAIQVRRLTQ